MKPEITVITPTYNRAHTLPIAFEGLKKQTFQNFLWMIMDDGSTDRTTDLVQEFKKTAPFEIRYFKNRNRHKFLTVLEGIKLVRTKYFMVLDSDDTYPDDAMDILIQESEKIKNQDDFIGVMGLSAYQDGQIVGDRYPGEGFDGSILEMRYKYKVRGDKNGIFFTQSYQKAVAGKDFSAYENKGYIPQSVIFNDYDARGLKTRFINRVVRYYLLDQDDAASVSNTRWTGRNIYGLREGHLSFLNSYNLQLFQYPVALLRNIIGYQSYSFKNKLGPSKILGDIAHPLIKTLNLLLLPLGYIYHQLNG